MKKIIILLIISFLLPLSAYGESNKNIILAQNLISQKKIEEAKSILFPLIQDLNTDNDTKKRAFFYLSYCDSKEAGIIYIQQAISLGATNAVAYYRLAELQYESRKIDDAISNLNIAVSRENENKILFKIYKLMSKCYIDKKNWEIANIKADEAIRKNPNDIESYYLRGITFFELSMQSKNNYYENAINDFDIYIRNGEDNENKVKCLIYKGNIFYKSNKSKETIDSFEKATRLTDDKKLKNKLLWRIKSIRNSISWNS